MKKNFFATLIIAALIVVMSFTLTSCDFFNRGNGSGSNGGDNSNDGDSVLNGLDSSKLSAEAKKSKKAQQLALMVDDEFFEVTNLLTRENLAIVLAECLKDTPGDDPYMTCLWGSDDSGKEFEGDIIDNNDFYNALKEMNYTLEELIYDIGDDAIIDDSLNEYIEYMSEGGIIFHMGIDNSYEGKQYIEERKQERIAYIQSASDEFEFVGIYGDGEILAYIRNSTAHFEIFQDDRAIWVYWA